MKLNKIIIFSATLLFMLLGQNSSVFSQENKVKKDSCYTFKTIYKVPSTTVKDQDRSGTCWSFGGVSFLESEIIRNGHGELDISEMFIVRHTYPLKALNYVRMHGTANFGAGGQFHDVLNIVKNKGIVPEKVFTDNIDKTGHNHGEMDAVLGSFVKAVKSKKGGKITPKWLKAFNSVLDVYLGENPEEFEYEGNIYTPLSFAKHLDINPDDYIELTSYSHHPYHEKFILEIPDNWSLDEYYNLPLDELLEVINFALKNGYSVAWDGDVSDRYFSFKNGVATVPEKDWNKKSDEEKNKTSKRPEAEKIINQELRQEAFDNQTSTDDHLMHLTGLVEDQHGTKYYVTKNSWNTDRNDFGGYLNMSESYIRLKTIAIMIHKDALPKKISKKLGI